MKQQVDKAIAEVQGIMNTARADTVARIDKYSAKYRPVANKYNKWCGAAWHSALSVPDSFVRDSQRCNPPPCF